MLLLCAILFGTSAWADDVVYYTLDGTKTDTGGSSAYDAPGSDVIQNGMNWSVKANCNESPWRVGGKGITGVDREVYSKTAMDAAVTKVELEVGNINITVNSITLIVASNSDFSTVLQTIEKTSISANSTLTFEPTGGNWATGAYYKFVFNVTNTGTSNKYIHFKNAKFYKAGASKAVTTTTINSTGITNTDVYVSTAAGTLTATVTPDGEAALTTPTITWSSNATGVATIDESTGVVTLVAPGDVTFTATFAGDDTYKASNATYNMTVTTSEPGKTFYLVNDASQLANGDKIIIVYEDELKAISTTQATNNRPATDIEIRTDGSIFLNAVTDVQVLTLEKTGTSNVWYLQVGDDAYLYAASSTANNLKTGDKDDASVGNNAKAAISFSGNNAHILFQGSNTRNELRFNPNASNNNPLFSCYATSGTTGDPDVQIYKEALPVTVTIPAGKEWITFCSTANLDFSEAIEGLKGAYTITAHADKAITLTATEMTGKVKAGTGLLLRAKTVSATDAQVINIPVAATGEEQADNMLKGVTEDTEIAPTTGEYTNLGLKDGEFHPYTNGPSDMAKLKAGKAYLQVPTAQMPTGGNNARLYIVLDGEATGIANVDVNANDNFDNAPMYNLAGQRVTTSYKGVVIVNGKKYINK